jgi:hypothetical protein
LGSTALTAFTGQLLPLDLMVPIHVTATEPTPALGRACTARHGAAPILTATVVLTLMDMGPATAGN